MKFTVISTVALASLLGADAMADVSVHKSNAVVLAAELTFAATSLYMGVSNGTQGHAGNHNLSASLFGLAVGVTSLALSTHEDAEVQARPNV